ncbi:uncharacterized protein EV154DRAFT_487880 [Mucor mucedo]|uniref:uncharacterized protein n=1 Tax=Mucor mucedo TaxID=29922 RepID=UPI00221FA8DA|nr:uncharacterized protein EV154DRAFT_487880 [Mucor mucedo]KAI7870067.1 hypothetical protein EV154DRAFT_487880 [Mucor mucedo]
MPATPKMSQTHPTPDKIRRFDGYEAKFTALEAIIQDWIILKVPTLGLENKLSDQAAMFVNLQLQPKNKKEPNSSTDVDQLSDLASNGSICSEPPPPSSALYTIRAASRPKDSPGKPGLTMAQKVAINSSKLPPNTTITSAKTYMRFKLAGVDTGCIIDIIFPANGIISALINELYTPIFTNIINVSNVNATKVFDPLDPAHLANPLSFRHQRDDAIKYLCPVIVWSKLNSIIILTKQIFTRLLWMKEFRSVIRQDPIRLRTLVRYPSKSVDFRVLRSVILQNPLTSEYSGPLSVVMRYLRNFRSLIGLKAFHKKFKCCSNGMSALETSSSTGVYPLGFMSAPRCPSAKDNKLECRLCIYDSNKNMS